MKKALITGITGQYGAYLAEFLLKKGYEVHGIKRRVELAFSEVGIELRWEGEGVEEKGINGSTDEVVVEVDSKYFRPTEVGLLIGDPSKAEKELGWKHKYELADLLKEMVLSDVKLFEKDRYLKEGGYQTMNYFE